MISGNEKWDYIPGWDCWISAHWTGVGCEGEFSFSVNLFSFEFFWGGFCDGLKGMGLVLKLI